MENKIPNILLKRILDKFFSLAIGKEIKCAIAVKILENNKHFFLFLHMNFPKLLDTIQEC